MTAEPLRILCVDDHEFVVEGLRARLGLESDMEVVGWLDTPEDLVGEVGRTRADIVLLDIELPGHDPFEVLADLTKRLPDVRTIILSAFVRDQYVDAAVTAGAWGFLSKGDAPGSVVDAIRKVAADEFAFGPMVIERCLPGLGAISERGGSVAALDAGERRILGMIAQGLTCADIAGAIRCSVETVEGRRAAIMRTLGVGSTGELARLALREGLVE